jgi:hypothetical protein
VFDDSNSKPMTDHLAGTLAIETAKSDLGESINERIPVVIVKKAESAREEIGPTRIDHPFVVMMTDLHTEAAETVRVVETVHLTEEIMIARKAIDHLTEVTATALKVTGLHTAVAVIVPAVEIDHPIEVAVEIDQVEAEDFAPAVADDQVVAVDLGPAVVVEDLHSVDRVVEIVHQDATNIEPVKKVRKTKNTTQPI